MIESLSATTVVVADMRRSVPFYQALGFRIHYGGPEADFTSLLVGTSFHNLMLRPGFTLAENWGRIIFYVTNVDETHRQAIAAGLTPEFEPRDAEWGERYFHILDPDGHELSFAHLLAKAP